MADKTSKDDKIISIKVFVDKVKRRVVYAEADHTFVDILFSFLTLPMGTIVRLLAKHDDNKFEALGSLNNLYQSLKDLPERYLATEECKSMLLNPRSLAFDHCRNLELVVDDTEPMEYFICKDCGSFSICDKAKCRSCGKLMNKTPSPDINVCRGGGVFVSDIATFIVTDDFSVMPYTAAGSIELLTELGITNMSNLEERKLNMGCQQMVYLLKMALSHGYPFSHLVFDRNKRVRDLDDPVTTFDRCGLVKKETASSKMLLQVTLQKSTGKVLFAEAKEHFVDFLFGFLSIPLGTVIGTLMDGTSSLSCMDNLFKSISSIGEGKYFKSQDMKDMLLKPDFGQQYSSKNHLFSLVGQVITHRWRYRLHKLQDPRVEEAYLKQPGMSFVTDDLVITPSSSCSTMDTLNKLKVQLDDMKKYEISIGLEEGLKILKASLRSRMTLTSIMQHKLKK